MVPGLSDLHFKNVLNKPSSSKNKIKNTLQPTRIHTKCAWFKHHPAPLGTARLSFQNTIFFPEISVAQVSCAFPLCDLSLGRRFPIFTFFGVKFDKFVSTSDFHSQKHSLMSLNFMGTFTQCALTGDRVSNDYKTHAAASECDHKA